jgi:TorA maturation chaperone TorD
MDKTEYRAGVYAVLAEAFKEPTQDFMEELPEIAAFLQEAFIKLDYPAMGFDFRDWPSWDNDLAALKAAYTQSFIFPPETRVVPVESVYRQWTHDSGAQVPFAREKGYLMSDAALHMQALYQHYRLTIPEEYYGMPDHVCLELEFAALLLEQASPEQQAVFWREHLDWVDELLREALEKELPPFYRGLISVTARFLQYERECYAKPCA